MDSMFGLIFFCFLIFLCCSLFGYCCRRREPGAIFSTPVVITSQTHQPVGSQAAYPVYASGNNTSYNAPVAHPSMPMPMPYTDAQAPYPQMDQYRIPSNAPYGNQPAMYPPAQAISPYPPQSSPYPPQSAPYNPQTGPLSNPPAYNEVMGKQAPFNPNFSG